MPALKISRCSADIFFRQLTQLLNEYLSAAHWSEESLRRILLNIEKILP